MRMCPQSGQIFHIKFTGLGPSGYAKKDIELQISKIKEETQESLSNLKFFE